MSIDILLKSGESGAVSRLSQDALELSAAATIPELYSTAPATSDADGGGSGISFSDSNVLRFSSTMHMLMTAPRIAMQVFTHQGRTSVPSESPADCKSPDTVGPKARHALAADAAAPFKEPRTLLEGAEFASMMLLEGKAKAWAVTFQTNAM